MAKIEGYDRAKKFGTVRYEDLPPFSGPLACVKCGEHEPKAEYFATFAADNSGYGYLIRTCCQCGYEWREHCADHI